MSLLLTGSALILPASAAVSYVASRVDGSSLTTYSWSDLTLPAGARLAVIANMGGTTGRTLDSASIDGVTGVNRTDGTFANSRRSHLTDTGTSTITGGTNRTVSLTFSGSYGFRGSAAIFNVSGKTLQTTSEDTSLSTAADLDVNTTAGDLLVCSAYITLTGGTTTTNTGLTERTNTEIESGAHYHLAFTSESAAGGSPENLQIGFDTTVNNGTALLGVYR